MNEFYETLGGYENDEKVDSPSLETGLTSRETVSKYDKQRRYSRQVDRSRLDKGENDEAK